MGDGRHEREVLAAGQDETARGGVGVDEGLDVGEELGDVLDFVDDGPRSLEAAEKTAGIGLGHHARVGVFEGDIGLVGKCVAAKRGFARLARAVDGHDGKGFCPSQQFWFEKAKFHDGSQYDRGPGKRQE